MVRYRAASAFAPLPFDKHGVPGSIEIVEDFMAAITSAEFADTTGITLLGLYVSLLVQLFLLMVTLQPFSGVRQVLQSKTTSC